MRGYGLYFFRMGGDGRLHVASAAEALFETDAEALIWAEARADSGTRELWSGQSLLKTWGAPSLSSEMASAPST